MTDYEMIATILASSDKARKSNEYCVAQFFLKQYGITRLDEVGKNTPNYQTVLRKIRKIKEVRPELKKYSDIKAAEEDKYKEIALKVPYVERIF